MSETKEEIERRIKRTIKVNLDTDAVAEKVAESMKQQKAMEYFEKEKRALNIQYNTTDFNDCNSPKELGEMIELQEQLKADKLNPKRVVNGKYQIDSVGSGEEFDSPEQLMDYLYNTGYPRGRKVQTPEGIEARKKIDKLFKDMISGKGWEEMKKMVRDGEGEKMERILGAKTLMRCPKCGATISTYPPCVICKYDPREEV